MPKTDVDLIYKVRSISLPPELGEELRKEGKLTGEPLACILRQVARTAIARGWDAESLGVERERGDTGRVVLRLSATDAILDQLDRLRGEHALGTYLRFAAAAFLTCHKHRDREIWNLLQIPEV